MRWQDAQPGMWTDAEQKVRRALQQQVAGGALVGAQYLAVSAEGTQIELHVGSADAATSRQMERTTSQMAYSITKAVTAIALLRLADAGALSLEQSLSDYFRAHPYGDAVRLRHLLAHTAGIPSPAPLSWFFVEGEALERSRCLRDVLRSHARLRAAPGSTYRYSNLGYWLLEEVIQAASGMDYAEYVQRHIFGPLGEAERISFEPPDRAQMAVGHTARFHPMGVVLRALTPRRYWASSVGRWRQAARVIPFGRSYGGLFCPADALAPLLGDLLRPVPRLLSAAARDLLFEPQRVDTGQPTGDALGWVCGRLGGVSYRGKQGGGLGFSGNVRVYPDLGVATVLLANVSEVSAGPIDRRSDQLDLVFVQPTA